MFVGLGRDQSHQLKGCSSNICQPSFCLLTCLRHQTRLQERRLAAQPRVKYHEGHGIEGMAGFYRAHPFFDFDHLVGIAVVGGYEQYPLAFAGKLHQSSETDIDSFKRKARRS